MSSIRSFDWSENFVQGAEEHTTEALASLTRALYTSEIVIHINVELSKRLAASASLATWRWLEGDNRWRLSVGAHLVDGAAPIASQPYAARPPRVEHHVHVPRGPVSPMEGLAEL